MPQAIITAPDGRKARVTFETQEQLDSVTKDFVSSGINQQQVDASKSPDYVDPSTGKTRAQLESELATVNAQDKPLPWWATNTSREFIRGVGRVGRDVGVGGIQGISGLADLASLPINFPLWLKDKLRSPTASELVTGKKETALFPATQAISTLEGKAFNAADPTGQTLPQTPTERVLSNATRATSGALMTAGIGGASPIANTAAGRFLAARPGLQATSAAMGGTAAGVTKESGGGTGAQLTAALLAGSIPSIVSSATRGLIGTPNAEGKVLAGSGAENLTPGQLRQGGIYSQVEDASTHLPIVGPMFKKAKEAGQESAKDAWIATTGAPGSYIRPTGNLHQTLADAYSSFTPAYEKLSGYPLVLSNGKPVIVNKGQNTSLASAFSRAVADRSIDASNSTRQQAAGWLKNLLTRPFSKSEDLLSLRSEIRTQISKLANDASTEIAARREIYQAAEQQVTNAIESQLPKNILQHLKDTDLQYARYKIAEDAMVAAKDRPGGFTWEQASNAVAKSAKSAVGKAAYAQGSGFMRDIPAAARKAFAERPPTGASLTAQALSVPAMPFTAYMTLTKGGRNLAANNPIDPFSFPASAANSTVAQTFGDREKKK